MYNFELYNTGARGRVSFVRETETKNGKRLYNASFGVAKKINRDEDWSVENTTYDNYRITTLDKEIVNGSKIELEKFKFIADTYSDKAGVEKQGFSLFVYEFKLLGEDSFSKSTEPMTSETEDKLPF